ncbi:MAG: DedA family protein [Candidatus Spyradosoma sp.]
MRLLPAGIFRGTFAAAALACALCGVPARAAEPPSAAVPAETVAVAEKSFPEKIVAWYADHLNYGTVALLMAVESSFIPFPSEVVVPPAAYAACTPGSPLYATEDERVNVAFVVLAGTLGALVGALANYWIALFFGRPLVNRFAESRLGSLCLIDRKKVEKSEAFFRKYGVVSTFFGRLVPVVRQLISIPAGIARMRMLPFVVFTTLGAAIWNVVLAVVGVVAHGRQDAINEYSRELSWAILVCAALFGVFLLYRFWRGAKK